MGRGLPRSSTNPVGETGAGRRLLCMSKCRRRWCRAEPGFQGQRGEWLSRRWRAREDIPATAPSPRGCTGWVRSRSSRGTTAAPRSKWLSRSRWRPAGRGRALESQRRVAPPRTPPEETGRKEAWSELSLAGPKWRLSYS